VGFDDIPMAAMAHPPLTTIRQQKTEVGALASRALMACIAAGEEADEGERQARAIAVPVTLVVRESTATVASEKGVV
jgi:DNA-binding LacI/PurR family transcriptional regulator